MTRLLSKSVPIPSWGLLLVLQLLSLNPPRTVCGLYQSPWVHCEGNDLHKRRLRTLFKYHSLSRQSPNSLVMVSTKWLTQPTLHSNFNLATLIFSFSQHTFPFLKAGSSSEYIDDLSLFKRYRL